MEIPITAHKNNKDWQDDYEPKEDDPEFKDKFIPICNTARPIGDIGRWKALIEIALAKANNEQRVYLEEYYPEKEHIAYGYEDLIPGTNVDRNVGALRRFYDEGYKFYRSLMMWYLENGQLQQYLNACSAIYYCDRDHPDFWLLLMRASEVAAVHPNMFVAAVYQYFNWTTFDGIQPVPIMFPQTSALAPLVELLKKSIIQRKKHKTWWSDKNIKYDFVIDYAFLKNPKTDDDTAMDEYHENVNTMSTKFGNALDTVIATSYPEVVAMLILDKDN
jgi:hypothetical protein